MKVATSSNSWPEIKAYCSLVKTLCKNVIILEWYVLRIQLLASDILELGSKQGVSCIQG